MLDGSGAGAGVIERNTSALAGNKVRKLTVEPEPRSRHDASYVDAWLILARYALERQWSSKITKGGFCSGRTAIVEL